MSDSKGPTDPQSRSFPRRPMAPSEPLGSAPSPWSAPESLLDPLKSNRRGRDRNAEPTKEELAKFFRRVNRPDLEAGPLPHRWQRGVGIFGTLLSVGAGVFMVFYMNFGYENHCFTPLRRWAGTQDKQVEIWRAQKQDSWIKKTGFTREELTEMVGEEELEKAEPDRTRRPRINLRTLEEARAKEAAAAAASGSSSNAHNTSEVTPTQVKGSIWTRERV